MTDSVKVLSSINKTEVINSYSVKRMAILVDEKDVPKFNKDTMPAGFKADELYRFVDNAKDLVSWGFKTDSESYKFAVGALKAKGKYANIDYLPSLTADLEVLLIVKKEDKTCIQSINNANLTMKFGYYGLCLAKTFYTELKEVINTFSKEYLIAIEDDKYFGDISEPVPTKTGTKAEKHIFDELITTNTPVSLNYQIPKTRGELEFPISAVVVGYVCATFGTQRPGVTAYFKKLEGVASDNLPKFVIDKIDIDLERKINTYRANESDSYKWNILADGESVELSQLIKYTESVIKTNNQNLLKSAIPYNDDGFKEIKEDTERFLGLLLRANKINNFEVIISKFDNLNDEDREKQRFPYTAKITAGGVTKELDLFAIWSK